MIKKIVSAVLAFCLLFPLSCAAFAEQSGDKAEKAGPYPYIFVHGMMGWGSYDGINDVSPYWGVAHGDMLDELAELGYVCRSASVGKISSIWDRACELYAQLTGTVVDYGEAHSAAHHHLRYGRSYEGRALLDNFGGTDADGNTVKINLFGHSLGGPTVRLFAWLMANGSAEEREASGDGVSPFFVGGKAGLINSVTTWSAPHNGTPISNILYDKLYFGYILSFMANILGSSPAPGFWDYQLEQYGLTSVPAEGKKARLNLKGIKEFVQSDDNCGYDLTIRGAAALNDAIDIVDDIYYFSYTGKKVKEISGGRYISPASMFPLFYIPGFILGRLDGDVYDGVALGEEWRLNDGMVPVVSARAPFDEPVAYYTEGAPIEKGVWNAMPVIDGYSHVSYMGMDADDYGELFLSHMRLIDSLG